MFKTKYSIAYPVIDGDNAVKIKKLIFKDYHFPYPTSVLISKTGKMLYVKQGYTKKIEKDILSVVSTSE